MGTRTGRSILISATVAILTMLLPLSAVHAMGKSGVRVKSADVESPALRTQGARGSIASTRDAGAPGEVESLRKEVAALKTQLASIKDRAPTE